MQQDNSASKSRVLTVPFGSDFSDATAALVFDRFGDDPLIISNIILFLPNNRAIRAMTEAFVRRAAPGLLLPRMVAIGDLALDEALGPVIEPINDEEPIWPAITATARVILLTELVIRHRPKGHPVSTAEALRLAGKLTEMIDELEIEQINFELLDEFEVEADLAEHWQQSFGQLLAILPNYKAALAQRKLLGPAERRNILLGRLEQRLHQLPVSVPIVAAGITTAAPAIARLLRRITRISDGLVILPGVDLAMAPDEWDALRPKKGDDGAQKLANNVEVHPQFHLKLLLDRMGIGLNEVASIDESMAPNGETAIADIFCLPAQSAKWRELSAARKRLANVQLAEADDSAHEAKIIAVRVRAALEQPNKRVAVVTPDRELATRVAAQLRRWGVHVDDSAGKPLLQTPAGTLILALAEAVANSFSATHIMEIAKHPFVKSGEERLAWLEHVRAADLLLRGPAKGFGMDGVTLALHDARPDGPLMAWWTDFAKTLEQLNSATDAGLDRVLEAIRDVADDLTGGQIWKGPAGRELARVWAELGNCNLAAISITDIGSIPAILAELLKGAVVRPPYGGHPRAAIYGLLEARMQRADIVICAGLNETVWPQIAQPDPWLAPLMRRKLGLATLDRNIGLSAHDLATALGAPEVLLTRAKRDRGGPTVASRFLLRIKAFLGGQLHIDDALPMLANKLDEPQAKKAFASRPTPMPAAAQRRVRISVTDFDQLKSDPYSFYAKRILRLNALEIVDAEPGYAWRGTLVHNILQHWFQQDDCDPEKLAARAEALLDDQTLDPILRTLWQPRIAAGLRWIADETQRLRNDGRRLLVAEARGEIELLGVRISGRADRIDAEVDGKLVIIDYKTGMPPKPRQVNAGFALQLGLIGLMAEKDGIEGVRGEASAFEYWSLAKNKDRDFGFIAVATSSRANDNKQLSADFVGFVQRQAEDALSKWILGNEPFTAKLHPEYSDYADYDQLMRRQEWDGRQTIDEVDAE